MDEEGHADLGAIQDTIDPKSRFALQHQARAEAKKAFVHMDTSKRVQRALLRNAKPIPHEYAVGDIVTFHRDGKTVWSPASRVIGREGSEGQDVWLLCENVPVLVSAQNLRPATDAEALAHQVLNEEPVIPDAIARGNQEFEDHRGAQPETPVEEPQVEEEDPFDLPLASIMEEEEAPNEPVRMRTVRTDALDRAEGSERSVRPRHESRVEPEAERPPSRRASSYDITDDLPEQIRSQLADAHTAQFGDLSGTMTKKQCQTWTAFKAFMANRVLTKEQVEHQQREEYKRLPGILNYHTASPFIRRKIDQSRAKEWKKYEDFQAAIPIKGQDLLDWLTEGHIALPMKWVDTIKNIHEQHKPDFEPEFKSRLVGCGNFEDATGVRTDAPTSDLETHSIVAAFAVAEGVPPQSSDIRNAYFQALPIDRIVIMRQPSGGLPGVDPEAYLLIRVPVYGLCDSGRGFWKKVNHNALDVGLKASRIFPAFYYHESGGRVGLVLTTHVDDFLGLYRFWAGSYG